MMRDIARAWHGAFYMMADTATCHVAYWFHFALAFCRFGSISHTERCWRLFHVYFALHSERALFRFCRNYHRDDSRHYYGGVYALRRYDERCHGVSLARCLIAGHSGRDISFYDFSFTF